MRRFLLFFLLVFLWAGACKPVGSDSSKEASRGFKAESVVLKEKVDKNHTRFRGALWKAVGWEDARGKNTLILSARPKFKISEDLYRKRVYAYHYLERADTLVRINYMTDFADSCFCDCSIYLVDTTVHVDDFNGDGVGDVWFAYYVDSRCDVSPLRASLQLWSDGEKVVLSGLVPPPEDEHWFGSLPRPEFVLSSSDDVLLRGRAIGLWKELFD